MNESKKEKNLQGEVCSVESYPESKHMIAKSKKGPIPSFDANENYKKIIQDRMCKKDK